MANRMDEQTCYRLDVGSNCTMSRLVLSFPMKVALNTSDAEDRGSNAKETLWAAGQI